jgi:superfamily II DNA/RNA helicase
MEKLVTLTEQLGFKQPTLIQERVYQPLQQRKNVLGLAPTGSGKTLAYVLPLLQTIAVEKGTQLLIITPSQELTAQVTQVIRECLNQLKLGLTVTPLGGGANVKRQQEKLKKHPQVVVGTPGRLLELTKNKKLKLHQLQTVVFDEADALLTEQTLIDCRELLTHAPGQLQLAFFSATDGSILHDLPHWFGQAVERFDVRQEDQTQGKVAHWFLICPTRKRYEILRKFGRQPQFQGLVFINQLAEITEIAQRLQHDQIEFAVLDSQQRQTQRQHAIKQFAAGEIPLLLTTDVAARGLDLPQLPAVVNYDLPNGLTAYIHRVGRTGRMGQPGEVINLGNDRSFRSLKQLVKPAGYTVTEAVLSYGKIVAKQALDQPLTKEHAKVKVQSSFKQSAPAKRSKKTVEKATKKRSKNRIRSRKNKGFHPKKLH